MRQISFFLTTEAFLGGSKDVTRRLGWPAERAPAGTLLMAVNKCQGLKKGEQIKYGPIEILRNSPEPLDEIIRLPQRAMNDYEAFHGRSETEREGFPDMSAQGFVAFFCRANKCLPTTTVNRIVFRRIA